MNSAAQTAPAMSSPSSRSSRSSLWLFFAWLLAAQSYGLFLFGKGFFLNRRDLGIYSTCSDNPSPPFPSSLPLQTHTITSQGCWLPKTFSRAVIIIIDALRYDFTNYTLSSSSPDAPIYRGKLSILAELAQTQPSNVFLFQAIADAPTTTSQRLKAILTGSLPTFFEAVRNFDTESIQEDNLLHQLSITKQKENMGSVFMGDDTWLLLFPPNSSSSPSFTRAYPYPSFVVRDLDTVDNGVHKHFDSEMAKDDWKLLFAHFLGVDHAGHTFGPHHSEMERKLIEMDSFLRRLFSPENALNLKDTLVIVMGDHGMTESGDHGGDSDDEKSAALFVYSDPQTPLFSPTNGAVTTTIMQTDLVSSLSLLLGLPIPFGSLGTVPWQLSSKAGYESLLPFDIPSPEQREWWSALLASRTAAYQLKRYLTEYFSFDSVSTNSVSEFPPHLIASLTARIELSESEFTLAFQNTQNIELIQSAYHNFQSFSKEAIASCRQLWGVFDLESMVFGLLIMLSCSIAALSLALPSASAPRIQMESAVKCGMVWSVIAAVLMQARHHLHLLPFDLQHVSPLLLTSSTVVFSIGIFFIASSCSLIVSVAVRLPRFTLSFSKTSFALNTIALFAVVLRSIGLFSNNMVVLEDRVTASLLMLCIVTLYFTRIGQWSKLHHMATLFLLISIPFGLFFLRLRSPHTHLVTDSVSENGQYLLMRLLVITIAPFAAYKLSEHSVDKKSKTVRLFGAWTQYIFFPINGIVYIMHFYGKDFFNSIPCHLPQVSYLLAFITIASASVMCLSNPSKPVHKMALTTSLYTVLSGPAMFVTGPLYGLPLSLAPLQLLSLWYLINSHSPSSSSVQRIASVSYWLLSSHVFFVSGHQCTFNTIAWSSGFVGFSGASESSSASLLIPGVLVSIQTVSWPFIQGLLIPSITGNGRSVLRQAALPSLLASLSSLCALVLRRHLMIWSVFAPRLVFEAGFMLIATVQAIWSSIFMIHHCNETSNQDKNKTV